MSDRQRTNLRDPLAPPSKNLGYFYVAVSIFLVTFAQLAMKWGLLILPEGTAFARRWDLFVEQVPAMAWIFAGLAAYVFSMISWLGVLACLPLSLAYPLLSISYVLVYFLANLLGVFGENWSSQALLGICFILAGVWLVNSKDPQSTSSETR
ncbi:4-amino-4-deoxy-L-arabinose-phosphoundecaprenol flippase subunit ArnF [Rhodovibrionaceae bacterium A322]